MTAGCLFKVAAAISWHFTRTSFPSPQHNGVKEVIHVFEFAVLRHFRVGVRKQTEGIQSARSDVADFRSRRHANTKEQLIDLDTELKTPTHVMGSDTDEFVSADCWKYFRQGRCNPGNFCFGNIHPNSTRSPALCDFFDQRLWQVQFSRQSV